MPNNLIRVKQLDQSELSGFFAQTAINTGLISSIVNSIDTGIFVSLSGDQNVSGVKNFYSRPTVNGTGVLLSGEAAALGQNVVYTTGNQTISGVKTFNTGIFAPNLVYNTGNQTISGIKTFLEEGDSFETRIAGGDVSFHDSANGDAGVSISYFGIDSIEGLNLFADSSINLTVRDPNNFISFATSNIQRAVITSDGNFGIGTDTPSELLEVAGNIKADNLVYNTGDQTISGIKTFSNRINASEIVGGVLLISGDNIAASSNYIELATRFNEFSEPTNAIAVQEDSVSIVAIDTIQLDGSAAVSIAQTTGYVYIGQNINNRPFEKFNVFKGNAQVNGTGIFWSGIDLKNSKLNNASNVVYNTGDQTISGIKTFSNNIQVSGTGIFNSVDLNNIDTLSLSGVDITVTSGNVILTNPIVAPNIVYNTGDQTISGIKTFANSGVFSLSSANPLGLSNNPLSVVGSGNSYVQLNIQNRATGTSATADLVITSNNGTDTTNYINLGINNSGYNDQTFSNGSGLDGYLFINGGSLDIGTQTAGKNIEFHVGGTTLNKVIARIDESGFNLVSGNFTYPVYSGATGFIFTPDASTNTFFDYTLSGNSTLNQPINMKNGQSITIFLTQDATGNRSMSFNTGYLFSNGITPTLNFLPSGTDILQVIKARNKLYSTFASNY
jgi:hypothetical protein